MPTTTAADTLQAVVPFLNVINNAVQGQVRASPEVTSNVKMALDGVQQGITALAASETAVQSAPLVDRITADVSSILSVGATLPLPPPANIAFMIASMIFPAAVTGVKLMLAHHAPMASAQTD